MNHYSPTGKPLDARPHAIDPGTGPHLATKNIREVDCDTCIEILQTMGEYPRDVITGEWIPERANPNKAVK